MFQHREIYYTAIAAITSFLVWKFSESRINSSDRDVVSRRKRIVYVRNIIFIGLFSSVFGIWSDEISTFALSMVALAAATVVATKEFILSFLSTMFNVGQFGIRVGDTISIGDKRGRVVDFSPLSIRIMELDNHSLGYTGRELIYPSSILATSSVQREMNVDGFSLRVLKFQSHLSTCLEDEAALIEIANEACFLFKENAQSAWKSYSEQESWEGVGVRPKTTITIQERMKPDDIVININLRFAAPAIDSLKIEQVITRKFIDFKQSKLVSG